MDMEVDVGETRWESDAMAVDEKPWGNVAPDTPEDASMGARIVREAEAMHQRILGLREKREAINSQIKANLDEYGRLRRAAKLWERET